MFAWLVRRRLLRAGDRPGALIAALATGTVRVRIGDQCLAATARSMRDLRRWHARLIEQVPGVRVDLAQAQVCGPPWATLAILDWHGIGLDADGLPVRHRGLYLLRFAWGRLVAVDAFAHATLLAQTLEPVCSTAADEAVPALDARPWPA